jgi:hypothetical protein
VFHGLIVSLRAPTALDEVMLQVYRGGKTEPMGEDGRAPPADGPPQPYSTSSSTTRASEARLLTTSTLSTCGS